ncbi:MAG TPA: efflux RND transporter permease subunit [Bacillus bacterium]|nr:efflux RND transporter permease subunit [Bacillus sp. (in: firmicutes)]
MFKALLKRPLTVFMVVLMVTLMGLFMLLRIPVDLFPKLDLPIITITTINQGASPEEMEEQITKVIEEEMADLENIDSIHSTSSQNISRVMIQFNWGTNLNFSENEIRAKLEKIKPDLPLTIEKSTVEKVNPSDTPIIELAFVGEEDLKELTTVALERVKEELQRVKGVASVKIIGGQENEVKIALAEEKLTQFGINIGQVQEVLKKDNTTFPIGTVDYDKKSLTIKTNAEIKDVYELANLSIPNKMDIPLRLKDLGDVSIQTKEVEQSSYYNHKNAVLINIYKQNDANTIDVASKVTAKLRFLEGQLGSSELIAINDSSQFINQSIKNLTKEGTIGASLAILIIYFFLGEIAATLVIALAIPLSIITTFIFMYFSGLTVNLITLGALTLSIGLVVDDAIVVMQNIYRHYKEEGKSTFKAAIDGTKEVASAVFAATMTKMIVFLPMLFVSGMAGQIFHPLALTVLYALFSSLVISFTVTPTLTALVLSLSQSIPWLKRKSKWSLLLEKGRNAIENKYKEALVYTLKYRKIVLFVAFISLIAGIALLPMIGKEFMPKMDSGEFTIHIKMAPNTKYSETEKMTQAILGKVDEINTINSTYVGIGFTKEHPDQEQTDRAFIHVKLVDKVNREESTAFVIESLRSKLKYPGVQIKMQEKGFIMSSLFSSDPVFITIKGENLELLENISYDITKIIREVQGIRDADNSSIGQKMEYTLHFDKERLKSYGLDVLQVSKTIRTALEGEVVGTMSTDTGDLDIRLSYEKKGLNDIEDIAKLKIPTKYGMIPLQTFTVANLSATPSDIYRENQIRMSYVTAGLYNADLGKVNTAIQDKLAEYKLPRGYSIEFGGETKDMKESFTDLGVALVLAVLLIYMVMVAEFENFKHPFIIMFTIPLTLLGITGSLLLFGRNLSVPAILGIIMLSGIIVSNGIVMIEFMKQLREQGLDAYHTVLKAGPIRLTPILMTTGTAILGVAPIVFGVGEGSETNAPMATVVLGGLSVGTLLTLFVIPVLYYSIEKKTKRRKRWLQEYLIDTENSHRSSE